MYPLHSGQRKMTYTNSFLVTKCSQMWQKYLFYCSSSYLFVNFCNNVKLSIFYVQCLENVVLYVYLWASLVTVLITTFCVTTLHSGSHGSLRGIILPIPCNHHHPLSSPATNGSVLSATDGFYRRVSTRIVCMNTIKEKYRVKVASRILFATLVYRMCCTDH